MELLNIICRNVRELTVNSLLKVDEVEHTIVRVVESKIDDKQHISVLHLQLCCHLREEKSLISNLIVI